MFYMADIGPRFISTASAAQLLSVTPTTVRRLIHDGSLPVVRIGRVFRVPLSGIERFTAQDLAREDRQ